MACASISARGSNGAASSRRESVYRRRRSAAATVARSSGEHSTSIEGTAGSREDTAGSRSRRPRRKRTDLRDVPGIGPVTEGLLVARDIKSVLTLTELYVERMHRKERAMLSFLTEDVGVRNGMHAQSITDYIKEQIREDEENQSRSATADPRVSICVEGNISAGKTTFLETIIEGSSQTRDRVRVVPEPVDQWTHIELPARATSQRAAADGVFNVLDKFYKTPERYGYTFQNWVFFTRLMQQSQRTINTNYRLFERSVFSDRMVFADLVHENAHMDDMEMAMYLQIFDPMISMWPNLVPDGFIYLRAEPNTCFRRMNMRNREEEGGVQMDYLESLHSKHENWLGKDANINSSKSLILPGHPDSASLKRASDVLVPGAPGATLTDAPMTEAAQRCIMEAPRDIKDDVVFLGSSVHRAIQRVPALVLDVNEDIDLKQDVAAKEAYARKVRSFFDYLQSVKQNDQELAYESERHFKALDSIDELAHNLPRALRDELRQIVDQQRETVARQAASGNSERPLKVG